MVDLASFVSKQETLNKLIDGGFVESLKQACIETLTYDEYEDHVDTLIFNEQFPDLLSDEEVNEIKENTSKIIGDTYGDWIADMSDPADMESLADDLYELERDYAVDTSYAVDNIHEEIEEMKKQAHEEELADQQKDEENFYHSPPPTREPSSSNGPLDLNDLLGESEDTEIESIFTQFEEE